MNQKRLQLLHRLRKITINQPIPGHHDLIAGKIVIDEIQVDIFLDFRSEIWNRK